MSSRGAAAYHSENYGDAIIWVVKHEEPCKSPSFPLKDVRTPMTKDTGQIMEKAKLSHTFAEEIT